MKLYDCSMAPNPRRVNMFIIEKGLEIPCVQVDLMKGEQFSDEYRAINPLCDVPALVLDDGTSISQVTGICHYLEDENPEPPLYGRNSREHALVEMWDHIVRGNGLDAVGEAFRNKTPGFKGRACVGPHNYAQIPELAERGIARIRNFFADMDMRLADNAFVAGDFFSIADITAFVVCDFAGWAKEPIPAEREHLNRWYSQISTRESARATASK